KIGKMVKIDRTGIRSAGKIGRFRNPKNGLEYSSKNPQNTQRPQSTVLYNGANLAEAAGRLRPKVESGLQPRGDRIHERPPFVGTGWGSGSGRRLGVVGLGTDRAGARQGLSGRAGAG